MLNKRGLTYCNLFATSFKYCHLQMSKDVQDSKWVYIITIIMQHFLSSRKLMISKSSGKYIAFTKATQGSEKPQ